MNAAEGSEDAVYRQRLAAGAGGVAHQPWNTHRVVDCREQPDSGQPHQHAAGSGGEAGAHHADAETDEERGHHRRRADAVGNQSRRQRGRSHHQRTKGPEAEQLVVGQLPFALQRQHDDEVKSQAEMNEEVPEAGEQEHVPRRLCALC
jgi:hypothetical protein